MNLFSIITSKKFLISALFLFVTIFIYSLWERSPDIDDAWIGVDAYSLAKDGYVHNDLMRGINLQEELFVVHHKLLNLQGALFIKSFGFSLYTLKSVSLVYLLIFIFLFYFYTVKWKQLFTGNDLLFSMVLIFVFPWVVKYSFVYRPEIMMMTYGFIGFIFLEKYLENSKKKFWLLFVSGIFFGLTMATHLNGLILATSAFFLLLWNKKYTSIITYGFGVLIAFSIYFYDYTDPSYFELWQLQFFNHPSLDSLNTVPAWFKLFFNLLIESRRYFHNFKIIVYSIFLILSILIGFKYLYKNYTNLTRFAVLVAIFTGVLAMHKSRQYFLLNLPYLAIMITLTFRAINNGKIKQFRFGNSSIIKTILAFFFLIFIVSSTYFNIKFSMDKFSPDQNRELALKYTNGMESEMNIVAPMTFIFNEIQHFKSIQGDLTYREMQKMDSSIIGPGFLRKAAGFNVELILVESYYQTFLGIEHYQKDDEIEGYKVIDKTDQLLVFKRLR